MNLLLANWKYLAALLVVAGIFGAGAHWQHGRDQAKAERVQAIQAQRDAIAADAYAKATAATLQAERAAQAANERITNELAPKLAAATADGLRLASLLHDALSRPSSGAVSQGADSSGTAPASGVSASPDGAIERLTAQAVTACYRDAARLTALQESVRGQM